MVIQRRERARPNDCTLPSDLNGIDAARQIRKVAPDSRIILLTNECSAEVVQEAMDLGALGYVQKIKVGIDLRVAVEEVLEGRQFTSSGLIVDFPVAKLPLSNF